MSGSGLRVAVVDVPTIISLLVRSAAGKAVVGVAVEHVHATLNGEPLLVVAEACVIGQFLIKFTVREVGMHRLGVQVYDEDISGSEFLLAGVCHVYVRYLLQDGLSNMC